MNILRHAFLNSVAAFSPPDEEGKEEDTRTPAEKERDSITVTNNTDEKVEGKEEEKSEEGDEDKDDEENKEEAEVEDKEETDAEKETRLAQEKEDRKEARQQRKWDKLAAEKTAAERERDDLKKQLSEKSVEGLSEEEVERRATAKATELRNADLAQQSQKDFEKQCDTLEAAAVKLDPKFNDKVADMAKEIGPIPRPIIHILSDLDNSNGGDVLKYLADNVDEAEDIYALKDNSSKLTMKLIRLSDKLKAEKTPAGRQRSAVPPPITAVKEGNKNDSIDAPISGKEDMDLFVAKRNRQIEAKRKAEGYM